MPHLQPIVLSTLSRDSPFLVDTLARVESMKARGIVDQHFSQKDRVVVGITIEELDLFSVVHHALFAPADMRPVGRPNGSIGSGCEVRATKGHCIVPPALEGRCAVAVRN